MFNWFWMHLYILVRDAVQQDAEGSLCKKHPYSDLYWSPFPRIWTEYGEIFRNSKTRN